MRLNYNNLTRKTSSSPGIEFKLPNWGSTEDLEWVDTTPVVDRYDFGAYFYFISNALANRGYERGVNLFGAPYDFRRGPSKAIFSLLLCEKSFHSVFIFLFLI